MSMGGSPRRRVFLKIQAMPRAPAIPSRYIISKVSPGQPLRCGMQAAMSTVYTGRRAEQLMSGATKIVAKRSWRVSMVRVAMMPGMAQANDESMGMKLLPCSPTRLIRRSIKKAARDM